MKPQAVSPPPNLTPAMLHVMLALTDGNLHGYAIMQRVESISAGSMRLGPASLYGAIKRLLDAGLIEESEARPDPEHDDERRRYYRLTRGGRDAVKSETARMSRLVNFARARRLGS
jgi:DNA-binding PadR family transcriptional regulator